jgi:cytochrome P450
MLNSDTQYGDIVRFGPNEVSFADTASVKYLHGPQGARLTKGPFYDANTFNYSGHGTPLPSTRDWENHRVRRRIWDHGFAQKSLRTYEPRIRGLIETLCTELAKHDGA